MGEISTKVYNHTKFTQEEIQNFPLLFTVKNKWRQRNVSIYKHPTDEKSVILVGFNFDGSKMVVVEEDKECWRAFINQLDKQTHFVTNWLV
jgi:hypothetical protein